MIPNSNGAHKGRTSAYFEEAGFQAKRNETVFKQLMDISNASDVPTEVILCNDVWFFTLIS